MSEEFEKYRRQAMRLKAEGLSISAVIAMLRTDGATEMATVYALKFEFGMTLSEADDAVLNSPVWADRLEATLRLRESAASVIENDGSWVVGIPED